MYFPTYVPLIAQTLTDILPSVRPGDIVVLGDDGDGGDGIVMYCIN